MYKLHLILKYLRRRRIAWVSLIAVTLCTAMVIVVISVMGGWLRMFETSARGMTGDVIVKADGLGGFPYYPEMVERIEKLPFAQAAVPQITTYGLVNIGFADQGKKTVGVQVFGIQIDRIGLVNSFPQSLYQQHSAYTSRGQTPPANKTFDLRTDYSAQAGRLPEGLPDPLQKLLDAVPFGDGLSRKYFDVVPHPIGDGTDANLRRIFYTPRFWSLAVGGRMTKAEQDALNALSAAKAWRETVRELARESNYPGLIGGARLLEVRKNREGDLVGRDAWKYRELWAKLTVFGVGAKGDVGVDRAERTYWIVDDSRTGMWQYDNNAVYVPFEQLQADLGMNSVEVEDRRSGEKYQTPARASEINIRLKPGTDVVAARAEIAKIVATVVDSHMNDTYAKNYNVYIPKVETWREASRTYLDQIEREKVLVTLLFGVISLVAVFLIFCIFYMIVAEKTKDIGIIKSVGATNGGVAGIFLGYGLAIGIVGAGLGLLLSYLIVHNINEIHDWLGSTFRLVVYNPEVYAFDTIPNTMDPATVGVILSIAVLSAVCGSLIPAIVAARMQPVEALRWE